MLDFTVYLCHATDFFLQYEHWASTVRKEMEFWGNSIDDSNQMLCKHAIRWGIDENRILHRQAASLWGFFLCIIAIALFRAAPAEFGKHVFSAFRKSQRRFHCCVWLEYL